jgi:hypothetical protein
MGRFAETAIVDYRVPYRLPTKETKSRFPFPLAASKGKFAVSVFRLQKTCGSCRFGFPFAENRQKSTFSVTRSSVFVGSASP